MFQKEKSANKQKEVIHYPEMIILIITLSRALRVPEYIRSDQLLSRVRLFATP